MSMIGKTFSIKMDGELRTYEIISIDPEDGWIKLKRHGLNGHFYLNEQLHKSFLDKLGYQRIKE